MPLSRAPTIFILSLDSVNEAPRSTAFRINLTSNNSFSSTTIRALTGEKQLFSHSIKILARWEGLQRDCSTHHSCPLLCRSSPSKVQSSPLKNIKESSFSSLPQPLNLRMKLVWSAPSSRYPKPEESPSIMNSQATRILDRKADRWC